MAEIKKVICIACMVCCFLFTGSTSNARDIYAGDTLGMPMNPDSMMGAYPKMHNSGSLADFPKVHPLVVHIPVVFLLLALIAQLISFAVFKKELSWVTLVLVVVGFIGAYLASTVFHGGDPDLSLLDPISRHTFEMHKLYAGYTVWISGIAAGAKIISHFFFKRKLITELIVMVMLAGAAYCVIITGDMGARLVFIDGIGVQGHHIPAHDNM